MARRARGLSGAPGAGRPAPPLVLAPSGVPPLTPLMIEVSDAEALLLVSFEEGGFIMSVVRSL
jgi:hypothetical protein